MKKITIGIISAFLFFASSAWAGTPVKGDALKKLIVGNTLHGHHIKKDFDFMNYVAEDGSATRQRDDGKIHEGTWKIDEDGDLCFNFGRFGGCGQLEDNGDGTYTRSIDGSPLITLKKITPGKAF